MLRERVSQMIFDSYNKYVNIDRIILCFYLSTNTSNKLVGANCRKEKHATVPYSVCRLKSSIFVPIIVLRMNGRLLSLAN